MTVTADAGDRNAGAQAGNARDVQALFRLGHRAPENHVVDLVRIDGGRTPQRFADGGGGQLVGPRAAKRAVWRLSDRRANGGHDHRVVHISPHDRTL